MAEIVVVGGGIAGLAAAARLAKLRHQVTLVEATAQLGGALRGIEQDGFRWDGVEATVTLPAVLRDLLRKSGRPIENYLDLELCSPARRHIFADSSVVDLPTGSRANQITALDASLGSGVGAQWATYVDKLADRWQLLRQLVLDDPHGGKRLGDKDVMRRLDVRTSLAEHVERSLGDSRLRDLATYSPVVAGHDPALMPAYTAVDAYVERNFGLWQVPGGMSKLVKALEHRLQERSVAVVRSDAVTELAVRGGDVTSVRTANGLRLVADAVVTTIDPRLVFDHLLLGSAARRARRVFAAAEPAPPPDVVHLGLRGDVPPTLRSLPPETVLHGDPLITIQQQPGAVNGAESATTPKVELALTVVRQGRSSVDVVTELATRGFDVRPFVVTRIDRRTDAVDGLEVSRRGFAWDGWRRNARRAALIQPLPSLHLIGAWMHPGWSVPYATWGAAAVAERLGKA